MRDTVLLKFINLIESNLGMNIRSQDRDTLHQKLMLRKNRLKLGSLEDYYHHLIISSRLDREHREWRELINLLTTTESYFFRDQGQFLLLRNRILPELIRHQLSAVDSIRLSHQKSLIRPELRIWSAGCSTGEELYSIAILLRELLPNHCPWNLSLIGTDINEAALEKARRGIYSDWSFRLLSADIRKHYFLRCRDGWEIDPAIRQMVQFEYHNLVRDHPLLGKQDGEPRLANFHLILCRNVFIYFNPQAIAQSLSRFYQALAPAGYLLTGHTELQGLQLGALQVRCFPESIIYQRSGTSETVSTRAECPENINARSALAQETPGKIWTGVASAPIATPVAVQAETISRGNSTPEGIAVPTAAEEIVQLEGLLVQELYQEAIQLANSLLARDSQNFVAQCLLAEAYANAGNYEQAVQSCQDAIAIAPLAVEPYYLLAQVAEEQGDRETAKRLLKQVIYLSPTAIQAYLELGSLYSQDGDLAKSRKQWRSAMDLLQRLPDDAIVNRRTALTVAELKAELNRVVPQS
jgi:chemotaxis protein methyltransferase CheR